MTLINNNNNSLFILAYVYVNIVLNRLAMLYYPAKDYPGLSGVFPFGSTNNFTFKTAF